jgi:hypothetical protein
MIKTRTGMHTLESQKKETTRKTKTNEGEYYEYG